MSQKRDWRELNAPKWAKDAVEQELHQWKLSAALSWPTEAKPEPMPFRWGGYDRCIGDPVAGEYWTTSSRGVTPVEIRERNDGDKTWNPWLFRAGRNVEWSARVVRGPLYATEHDARLALLWNECEEAAKRLMKLREFQYRGIERK